MTEPTPATTPRVQGPNVKRLIIHKMALLIMPPGDGPAAAVRALTKPGNLLVVAREAREWVEEAIAVVKTAPDNPYADDEAIAGAILKGIEERKAKRV